MKDAAIIANIERLLAEGMFEREIARRLHVWRGLVSSIAAGKRPDYARLQRLREEEKQLLKRRGKRRWCPICRAKVRMPCVACRTREWMAKEGKSPASLLCELLDGPLGMQLKEEHRAAVRGGVRQEAQTAGQVGKKAAKS